MKSPGDRAMLRLTASFKPPGGHAVDCRQVAIKEDALTTQHHYRLRYTLD